MSNFETFVHANQLINLQLHVN